MKHNKTMRRAIQQGKAMEQKKPSKPRPCIACNGTGRYDHNGSPKCGACDGTGREQP